MIVDSGLLKVTHSIKAEELNGTEPPFMLLYVETNVTLLGGARLTDLCWVVGVYRSNFLQVLWPDCNKVLSVSPPL